MAADAMTSGVNGYISGEVISHIASFSLCFQTDGQIRTPLRSPGLFLAWKVFRKAAQVRKLFSDGIVTVTPGWGEGGGVRGGN